MKTTKRTILFCAACHATFTYWEAAVIADPNITRTPRGPILHGAYACPECGAVKPYTITAYVEKGRK